MQSKYKKNSKMKEIVNGIRSREGWRSSPRLSDIVSNHGEKVHSDLISGRNEMRQNASRGILH